ncbi:unnamed protein product [Phaeothamnion confervicola]
MVWCTASAAVLILNAIGAGWLDVEPCAAAVDIATTGTRSPREDAALLDRFDVVDADGDGVLEKSEIRELVAGTGGVSLDSPGEIDAGVARMLRQLDANDDRLLSRSDVLSHWARLGSLLTVSEVAEWVLHSVQLPDHVAERFRQHSVTGYDFPELIADGGALLESDMGISHTTFRRRLVRSMEWKLWGMGEDPRPASGVAVENTTACGSLLLRWEQPADGNNFPVHKYVLRRRAGAAAAAAAAAASAATAGASGAVVAANAASAAPTAAPALLPAGLGLGFGPTAATAEAAWVKVMDGPERSHRDAGLVPGAVYTYSLQAWNALGHSETVLFEAITASRNCGGSGDDSGSWRSSGWNGGRGGGNNGILRAVIGGTTATSAFAAAFVLVLSSAYLRRRRGEADGRSGSGKNGGSNSGGSGKSARSAEEAAAALMAETRPAAAAAALGGTTASFGPASAGQAGAGGPRVASSLWLDKRRARAAAAGLSPAVAGRSLSPAPGTRAAAVAPTVATTTGPTAAALAPAAAMLNGLTRLPTPVRSTSNSSRSSLVSTPRSLDDKGCGTGGGGGSFSWDASPVPPAGTSTGVGMTASRSLTRLADQFKAARRGSLSSSSESIAATGAAAAAAAGALSAPPPPPLWPAAHSIGSGDNCGSGNVGGDSGASAGLNSAPWRRGSVEVAAPPDLRRQAVRRLLSQQQRTGSGEDSPQPSHGACSICLRERKWYRVQHTCSRCHRFFCDKHGVSTHVLPGCPVGGGCTCSSCLDTARFRVLRPSESI